MRRYGSNLGNAAPAVALPFEKGQNWVMHAPCRPAGNYRGRGSWTLRIGDGLSERDGNIQDAKKAQGDER
jgi:hypothetical protein